MEVMVSHMKNSGTSFHSDASLRVKRSTPAPTAIVGRAFEDLGSSFTSQPRTPKATRHKRENRGQNTRERNEARASGSSSDEMDVASKFDPASDAIEPVLSPSKNGYVDNNGRVHQFHPKFDPTKGRSSLASLKFKKTKKTGGGGLEPGTSVSQSFLVPKKVGSSADPSSGRLSPIGDDGWEGQTPAPRPLQAKSPNRRVATSKPVNHAPTESVIGLENPTRPRPKPRPIPRSTTTMLVSPTKPKPFPMTFDPATEKKTTPPPKASGTASRVSKQQTTLASDKDTSHRNTVKKPKNVVSTKPSPTLAAPFPSLSPLASTHCPVRTVQPFPSLDTPKATTRKPSSKRRSVSPEQRQRRNPTRKSRAEGARIISSGDDSSDSQVAPKPFPMSTQMLNSIGSIPWSPPAPSSSYPTERTPQRGDLSSAGRKKRKSGNEFLDEYEEEDTITLSPDVDPRTLCPYCDVKLPVPPTPLLTRLLATTHKKSSRDPRPSNPLGRKAPLAIFIGVCQRHRFESETLPRAERKGWPKTIDWAAVGQRIEDMKDDLQALIDDPELEFELDSDADVDDLGLSGPKARNMFWREVVGEVKKKGSNVAVGVRGQFENFEKTQTGYYGELGSVIIHQTLYDLFPPASLSSAPIAPLTANVFLQRVLVPEVAVRLIMEDKNLYGQSGEIMARKILRDSSSYGVAMFPEDEVDMGGVAAGTNAHRKGWRGDKATGTQGDGMGVADMIVMERARKRRKELEVEERQEEQRMGEMDQERISSQPKARRTRKGKERAIEEVVVVEQPLPQAPRPKPRRIGPALSSASIATNEDKPAPVKRPSPAPLVDVETDPATEESDAPRRSARTTAKSTSGKRIPPKKSSSKVDVNLCSDSSTDTDAMSGTSVKRKRTAAASKRKPPKPSGDITTDEDIPATFSSRIESTVVGDVDMDYTPKPTTKIDKNTFTRKPPADLPPLVAARERHKTANSILQGQPRSKAKKDADWLYKLGATPDDTSSSCDEKKQLAEFQWLLSDTSFNSVGDK